jgi:GntR family transcriptional regulator
VKREGSKFSEIKQHLIQGIKYRHFKNKLPSENILADKFNVSRTTTRKVLSELESEGLIERIQGRGTFIKKQDVSSSYFKIQPSKIHAEQLNAKYSCKILELQVTRKLPAKIISRLQYDQQTVFVRRMHFFNDIPVRYEIRYLRGDLCGGIFWEDLEKISIHECLVSKYDLPLTKVWQRMTSEIMSENIAEIFGEPEGYPAFHIERVTYTLNNPVTAVEYFIRGELAFEDTYEPQQTD